jgi:hypothetical protein
MSRSYKHFPLFRDNLWGRSLKQGKRWANRKLRRVAKQTNIDIPNGNGYRRMIVDSWDLWEYKSYQTKENVISEWEQSQKKIANGAPSKHCYRTDVTLEKELQWWKASYFNK